MVSGVVRFPGALFNDEPFGITAMAPSLRIHIILPIATSWKASFSVLELAPADVAWERRAVSFFQLLQQIVRFPGSGLERKRRIDGTRQIEGGIAGSRANASLGIGRRDGNA